MVGCSSQFLLTRVAVHAVFGVAWWLAVVESPLVLWCCEDGWYEQEWRSKDGPQTKPDRTVPTGPTCVHGHCRG